MRLFIHLDACRYNLKCTPGLSDTLSITEASSWRNNI